MNIYFTLKLNGNLSLFSDLHDLMIDLNNSNRAAYAKMQLEIFESTIGIEVVILHLFQLCKSSYYHRDSSAVCTVFE